MPLFTLLEQAAARVPEKTSLIFADQRITFGDLYLHSRQVAGRLQRLNIGPGERVAILHENALSAVVYFWGILGSGAEVVDVPCLAAPEIIDEILKECSPAAIVLSHHQLERIQRSRAKLLPGIILMGSAAGKRADSPNHHFLNEIISSEPPDWLLPQVRDTSVAVIIYTSGTTGHPKGVMLSHRNLLTNIRAANSRVGITEKDSILVVVPLHFIHGRMQLLTHMLTRSTMAFSDGFHFPQQVVNDLAKYRVTGFSGTPYHFCTLLDRTNIRTCRLPSLRYVLITGGALQPERIRSLSEALPGVAMHIAYGQTEASPRISYLGPSEIFDHPGSSGRPLPGVLVQILAEDGSELPTGTVGEVVSCGPNTMCGYVSGDEISSGKIDGFGRLHTGDIGRLDGNGHLFLAGRSSDLIKSAGERVFPGEVESVLAKHPAVREVAVLGVPDTTLGERIVACVVLEPGSAEDPTALRSHCLKSLSLVRAPREIRFADCLPKTESGKVDRRAVVALFDELGTAKTVP